MKSCSALKIRWIVFLCLVAPGCSRPAWEATLRVPEDTGPFQKKERTGPPPLRVVVNPKESLVGDKIYRARVRPPGLGLHNKREHPMNAGKIALLIFLGLAFAGCNRQTQPPPNVAEVGTRMTTLMKQHRFNEAAQLGLDASARKADAMTYYWSLWHMQKRLTTSRTQRMSRLSSQVSMPRKVLYLIRIIG